MSDDPGGADTSPATAILVNMPSRVLTLDQYGIKGVERWNA